VVILNSPYAPPESDFSAEAAAPAALRWRAAVIFSFIPALLMALLQVSNFDSRHPVGSMATWEPTSYMLPPIVIAAASGYISGAECARSSLLGILPLGAKFGLIWTFGAVACGDVVVLLQSKSLPKWSSQCGALVVVAALLVPLATLLCAWVRHAGKKQRAPAGA
jgi:hypothetical protein